MNTRLYQDYLGLRSGTTIAALQDMLPPWGGHTTLRTLLVQDGPGQYRAYQGPATPQPLPTDATLIQLVVPPGEGLVKMILGWEKRSIKKDNTIREQFNALYEAICQAYGAAHRFDLVQPNHTRLVWPLKNHRDLAAIHLAIHFMGNPNEAIVLLIYEFTGWAAYENQLDTSPNPLVPSDRKDQDHGLQR